MSLLLGVEVHTGVEFQGLLEPSGEKGTRPPLPLSYFWGRNQCSICCAEALLFFLYVTGWTAKVLPETHPASTFQFDVFISAGGGRFVPEGETNDTLLSQGGPRPAAIRHFGRPYAVTPILPRCHHTARSALPFCLLGFKHKELRGKLAIGITANFVNRNTAAEAQVAEISGVARIYNQKFFQDLLTETGTSPRGRAIIITIILDCAIGCRPVQGVPCLPLQDSFSTPVTLMRINGSDYRCNNF